MTPRQYDALAGLCHRYGVVFDPDGFTAQFDLPDGYVAGWIGQVGDRRIYVGVSPEGEISS